MAGAVEFLESANLTAEAVEQLKTEEGRAAASSADMQDAPTAPLVHQAHELDLHVLSLVMLSHAESAKAALSRAHTIARMRMNCIVVVVVNE